jgi:hypothetical protein
LSEQSKEIAPRATIDGIDVWCRYDELAPIGALCPNPKNPNRHPKKQIERLAKIIAETGFRACVTVSRRSGFIVKGHGRLEAAKHLKLSAVPVEFQNYPDEAAEMADLLADNRIAELAELDMEGVGEILTELAEIDFDIELTGFEVGDVPGLDGGPKEKPPVDEEELEAKKNIFRTAVLISIGYCDILVMPKNPAHAKLMAAFGPNRKVPDEMKAAVVNAIVGEAEKWIED